jgi:hypothetical protein
MFFRQHGGKSAKGHRVAGSNDFEIFLEIQYASCVFGLV